MYTRDQDEDPVNEFKENAANGNAAIVFNNIKTSKLVSDDWN